MDRKRRAKNSISAIIINDLVEFLCTLNWKKLRQCKWCDKFFIAKTNRPQTFCSDKCRYTHNNAVKTKNGERAEYMKQKRAEGMYQ